MTEKDKQSSLLDLIIVVECFNSTYLGACIIKHFTCNYFHSEEKPLCLIQPEKSDLEIVKPLAYYVTEFFMVMEQFFTVHTPGACIIKHLGCYHLRSV